MDIQEQIKQQGNQGSVLLAEVMQNMGSSYYAYKRIQESAENRGWGSIVNAILSVSDFNGIIFNFTSCNSVDSIMIYLSNFANYIKQKIGPEAISNLPYDSYGLGENQAFYIPVTFVGIPDLSKGARYIKRDSSPGKIVIERGESRDRVFIGFKFFFNAGTTLSEYYLATDGVETTRIKRNFTASDEIL